jgi:hypothetical protein
MAQDFLVSPVFNSKLLILFLALTHFYLHGWYFIKGVFTFLPTCFNFSLPVSRFSYLFSPLTLAYQQEEIRGIWNSTLSPGICTEFWHLAYYFFPNFEFQQISLDCKIILMPKTTSTHGQSTMGLVFLSYSHYVSLVFQISLDRHKTMSIIILNLHQRLNCAFNKQ